MGMSKAIHASLLIAPCLFSLGCDAVCEGSEYSHKLGTLASDHVFEATVEKRGQYYGFYAVAIGCPLSENAASTRACFPESIVIEISDEKGLVAMRQEMTEAKNFIPLGWHAPDASVILGWSLSPEEAAQFEKSSLNTADQRLTNGKQYRLRLKSSAWPSGAKGFDVYERYYELPWLCRR
jgi:hypothetical protein